MMNPWETSDTTTWYSKGDFGHYCPKSPQKIFFGIIDDFSFTMPYFILIVL